MSIEENNAETASLDLNFSFYAANNEYVDSEKIALFTNMIKTAGASLIIPYVKLEELLGLPFVSHNTSNDQLRDNALHLMSKVSTF